MMWDSSKGASTGAARTAAAKPAKSADPSHGPGESAKIAPIGVSVPSSDDALVLKPDQKLLKSATFPVYIDPQWYSPKAGSWTFASRYWASSPQWKFNGKVGIV